MNDTRAHDSVGNHGVGFDFEGMVRGGRRVRLGLSLCLVGWIHLIIFGICEILFLHGDRSAVHFLPLWVLDVGVAALVLLPRMTAVAVTGSASSARLLIRVWVTFAILCLTSASLNSMTGFQIDWFKISWAMLGTFGFAMLAWIFHLGFLVAAVLMSLTALLIAAHPDHAYLIFGLSWFLTCQGLGLLLEFGHLWQRTSRRECLIFERTSRE